MSLLQSITKNALGQLVARFKGGNDLLVPHLQIKKFTPQIIGRTSNFSSVTYTTQAGEYLRLGPLVIYWFRVGWSAASGGSGILSVNLPHAPASQFGDSNVWTTGQPMLASNIDLSAGYTQLMGELDNNNALLMVHQMGDNVVFSNVQVAAATSGAFSKELRGTAIYMTRENLA